MRCVEVSGKSPNTQSGIVKFRAAPSDCTTGNQHFTVIQQNSESIGAAVTKHYIQVSIVVQIAYRYDCWL